MTQQEQPPIHTQDTHLRTFEVRELRRTIPPRKNYKGGYWRTTDSNGRETLLELFASSPTQKRLTSMLEYFLFTEPGEIPTADHDITNLEAALDVIKRRQLGGEEDLRQTITKIRTQTDIQITKRIVLLNKALQTLTDAEITLWPIDSSVHSDRRTIMSAPIARVAVTTGLDRRYVPVVTNIENEEGIFPPELIRPPVRFLTPVAEVAGRVAVAGSAPTQNS